MEVCRANPGKQICNQDLHWEAYPSIFDDKVEVKAVNSIKTFYEKITILHKKQIELTEII